jgi:hypothetical protein
MPRRSGARLRFGVTYATAHCAILTLIPFIKCGQSILRTVAPSAKLADPHSVDPLGDHDLGMRAVANFVWRKTPARPFQRTASPARQVGRIMVGRDPARSLLCWLAFCGSPPCNRSLPDMSLRTARYYCLRHSTPARCGHSAAIQSAVCGLGARGRASSSLHPAAPCALRAAPRSATGAIDRGEGIGR